MGETERIHETVLYKQTIHWKILYPIISISSLRMKLHTKFELVNVKGKYHPGDLEYMGS
jgi:hypothetical protein